MLALMLVGISSVAQTAIKVEFVAGVDKGKNEKLSWGKAGADQVEKEGVTMKSDNALFAADKYMTKTYIGNKSLTFSATKSIVKIQFVDGEGLSHLTAEGFDDATATWTGKVKTCVQIGGIIIIYLYYIIVGALASGAAGLCFVTADGPTSAIFVLRADGAPLLLTIVGWVVTLVTIYSGYDYLKKNWDLIKDGAVKAK